MAEFNENLIKFGWLTKAEMEQAIADGSLNEYDICFLKDTKEQVLINKNLEPVSIKSRLRIYGSVEAAIEDIRETSETYPGEIISIKDGEKFIAYQVQQFESGEYYVTPVYQDSQIDYNGLQNAPIKNLNGSVTEPVVLADLPDGHYKITGHFITPKGTEVTSIVGNYIIVEQTSVNSKIIKRIASKDIFDYVITDGKVTSTKYATEQWVKDQGYATQDYVDSALAAFKVAIEEYIKEYVATTCTLLIKELIDQELDHRYSTEEDIESLFGN